MAEIRDITYEEFKNEFISRLEKLEGTTVNFYEKGHVGDDKFEKELVMLTNEKYFQKRSESLLQDFIVVDVPGEGSLTDMIRLNVEAIYEKYQSEGWNYVMDEVKASFKEIRMSARINKMTMGEEEWPREKMVLRPISYTDNKYQLKDAVYWKVSDIALVLYLIINEDENGLQSIKMHKTSLEMAGLDEESMLMEALLNTNMLYPPRIYENAKYNVTFEEGQFMDPSYSETLKNFKVYRLTTANAMNGAIALFYPGVQEKIAELIGGDYLIGFTSIHEAMIHSAKTFSARLIRDNIRELNRQFGKEDYLTNKVFRYNSASGKLEY